MVPIRIAVVEDDPATGTLVKFAFTNGIPGSVVDVYRTAQEDTLESLLTVGYNLYILDIHLPGYSGTELLTKIRENKHTHDAPVIMLTVRTMEKDILHCFNLGASDFVKKPFSPRELVIRGKRLLVK